MSAGEETPSIMNDKPYYTISIDIGSTNTVCSISSHKKAYPTLVSLNDLTTCGRSRHHSLILGALFFDEAVFWNDYALKRRIKISNTDFTHPIKRYLRNEGNLPTLPSEITIENLITDYLDEINKCAKQIISKSTQIKNISPSSITYCITLPSSLWTESTMELVRKAAIAAKLVEFDYQRDRLILMKESIAAATFCRKEYEIVNKQCLKTGEHFMVCDIGGKSMDVCVFEFTKLQDFMEISRAQSGPFGSAFFDTRAKSLLKEKIGMEFDFFQEKNVEKMITSIYIQTMCNNDYGGESCSVDLPESYEPSTNALRDIVDGKLTLTASELKETIYDPLFTNIFDLISKQFELTENKIDTIFITGGLGQSLFVQNKIKEEFGNMVSSIFIPRNGVFSIARGAIYSLTKKTKELVAYKKKEGNDEKKSYKVVMGIDFGTTYSGVAYSVISDYDQNHSSTTEYLIDVKDWKEKGSIPITKVPTVSAYKGTELKKWGYQTTKTDKLRGHKKVYKFKLHLNNEKDLPELPEGVSPLKAISDYLHLLHAHSMTILNRTGSTIFQEEDVRYCLTVPAMWTDQAKSAMRQAAIDAKIISANDPQDRLVLVGEPEAAALYCEKRIEEYNLKDGDRFLICDAGGGTVDLVVYQIKIDNGKKTLIEVSGGTGDICGAAYIDERMRYLIRSVLEELTESKIRITDSILDHCMSEFISSIKHTVSLVNDDDDDDDDQFISLPYELGGYESTNLESSIEDCRLHIPMDVIRKRVYKPITDKIMALIQYQFEQSQEKLDAIFLVGGFGQSTYLLQSIRKEYDPKVGLICAPSRGEMAIVRGAVLMGLNPQSVTERVIRRTYGFSCGLPFEEGDPSEHGYQSKANNAWYCRNRFLVYAKKDDIRSINHFVVREFVGSYGKQPILRLYAFDGSADDIPRYTFDDRVTKVAQFKILWPDNLGITNPEEVIEYKVKFYLYQTEIMIEVDVRGRIEVYTSAYESEEQPLEEHGIQGENIHGIQDDEINESSRENAIGFGTEKLKSSYNQTVAAAQSSHDVEMSHNEYGIQGVVEEDIKD